MVYKNNILYQIVMKIYNKKGITYVAQPQSCCIVLQMSHALQTQMPWLCYQTSTNITNTHTSVSNIAQFLIQ